MRLSKKIAMINIDDRIPQLIQYFSRQEEILAAYLYGSYGTKYQTPLSDVDLALLFLPRTKLTARRCGEIISDIIDIANEEDINVVILNEANLLIQFGVLSTGRVLFVRDRGKLADFIERILKLYGDFQIDMKEFYREYDQGLREEFSKGSFSNG